MQTTTKLLTALTITALLGVGADQALAGGCGSSAAKATQASTTTSNLAGIFDLAGQAGFTTLVAAIEAAGLSETLNSDGPFTVFAPTDEAFARLPEGALASLLADKDALTQVLLYHVTSGSVYAEDVVDLRAARTLNGAKVAINLDNGVQINDANVIETDVEARNGVIHVIDTVLIPASS